MEITGVEEVNLLWAGSGERITVRHPVEMIVNEAAKVRHYVCQNGTNVIVRNTWDVCTVVPTVLVEQEVEEGVGG